MNGGERLQAPVVWLLHDEKPGHRSQLKGLGNRLTTRAQAHCYWLDCTKMSVPLWRALLGIAPKSDQLSALPSPNFIIAAGTTTHKALLALRRKKGALNVVLMRPSFPLAWIDYAILPQHDSPPASNKTLVTTGALNTITPMARITEQSNGLILIGGPSKHYQWNTDDVLQQIKQLRQKAPEWRWMLSSSRRTPPDMMQKLQALDAPGFVVKDHRETHTDWLSHTLAASRAVWVTPDSVSMVYEGLTSGVPTGVFDLPANRDSRIARGVEQLCKTQRVQTLNAALCSAEAPVLPQLWEADRAAEWLLEKWHSQKKPWSKA